MLPAGQTPPDAVCILRSEYLMANKPVSSCPMPPLSVAVASLLDERPMHPYEISLCMRERHMEEAIKLNYGSLYHSVEKMLEYGVIEPVETSRDGRRPERTVYRLTTRGRECFQGRLRELIATVNKEYVDFEAGLAFMHHLDRDEAAELLERRARQLDLEIAGVDGILSMLKQKGLQRLSLVEVEHAQAMRRAQLEWTQSLARDIREGTLEWNVKPALPAEEVI
jgi:DNA-binding PadR family transcriptional regulator